MINLGCLTLKQWLRYDFKFMGSKCYSKFQAPITCSFSSEIWVHFGCFFPKLMGSGTHCSKIDGFPGTHGTHANGATAILDRLPIPLPLRN